MYCFVGNEAVSADAVCGAGYRGEVINGTANDITNTTLTATLRNGPDNDLWSTYVFVDVVVKMEYKSEVYYIKSTNNTIEYTH